MNEEFKLALERKRERNKRNKEFCEKKVKRDRRKKKAKSERKNSFTSHPVHLLPHSDYFSVLLSLYSVKESELVGIS